MRTLTQAEAEAVVLDEEVPAQRAEQAQLDWEVQLEGDELHDAYGLDDTDDEEE